MRTGEFMVEHESGTVSMSNAFSLLLPCEQMSEAGIEYVRIGEFMWSIIEPSPGVQDWDLLDKAVEVRFHRTLYGHISTRVVQAWYKTGFELKPK